MTSVMPMFLVMWPLPLPADIRLRTTCFFVRKSVVSGALAGSWCRVFVLKSRMGPYLNTKKDNVNPSELPRGQLSGQKKDKSNIKWTPPQKQR